jgi:hypothetical protein
MPTSQKTIQQINASQLDEILRKVAGKKHTNLALFGPEIDVQSYEKNPPDYLENFKCIYQLLSWDANLCEKIRHFNNLTSLLLIGNRIGVDQAKQIAKMTNLVVLILSGNQIGDDGAKYIAGLANLKMLSLRQNQITEIGVKHLAALKN